MMVNKHSNNSKDEIITLQQAILNKDFETARKLIVEDEVDVNEINESGETALHCAAIICNIELVQLLINHGAIIDLKNNTGTTPLFYAVDATRGQYSKAVIEVVKLL